MFKKLLKFTSFTFLGLLSVIMYSCIKLEDKDPFGDFDNSNSDSAYAKVVGRWVQFERTWTIDNLPGKPYYHSVIVDYMIDTMMLKSDRTFRSQVGFYGDCYGGGKFRIDSSKKITMRTTEWCDKVSYPHYSTGTYYFSIWADSMSLYDAWEYDSLWRTSLIKLVRR